MSSLYKLNGILKIVWLWAICYIGNEKGTGAEMYPTILSGSAPVSYWPVFSSIPSNSPRSHCERQPSVVSFSSRKVVVKNVHATIAKGSMGYDQFTVPDTVAVEPTFVTFLQPSQTYVHGLSCHSLKFLWRTVNSRSPTIPFGIVAYTFSDNLSRNSCIKWWINVRAFCDYPEGVKYCTGIYMLSLH